MEWLYTIDAYSEHPMMLLNKHIGYDSEDGQGIDGKLFAREILELDALKPKTITIYTNSLGGCVENGYDILSAIASCKSHTKSVIVGFAYSTAGWCTLSADEVEIKSYATGMMHMPHQKTEDGGQPTFVSMVADSICKILSEKSGRNGLPKKTQEEIKWMMIAKTYMTGDQMFEQGFVDRVVNSSVHINHTDTKSDYKQYNNILNKEISKTSDTMISQKVLNRLKLADGSDENEVIAAIARLENNLVVANKEVETATERLRIANESQEQLQTRMTELQTAKSLIDNSLTEKENQLFALNKQIAETTVKIENLEAEKLAADNKAKEVADAAIAEKAATLIQDFVTNGKIENNEETINVWNKMAVDNYEGTKVILEAMKTSMTVPTVIATPSLKVDNKAPEEGSFEEYRLENRTRLDEKKKNLSTVKG